MANCRKCNTEYDDGVTYCQQCNIDLSHSTGTTPPSFAGLLGFLIVSLIISIALLFAYWLYGALFWTVLGIILASGMVKAENSKEVTFYKNIKLIFIMMTFLVLCLIGIDYFMTPISVLL